MKRLLTVAVLPGWGPEPRRLVIRWPATPVVAALALLGAAAIVATAIGFVSLVRRAVLADDLLRERDALVARGDSMGLLAERLASLEAREDRLLVLSGLRADGDSALWLPVPPGASASDLRAPPGDTALAPTLWPLTERGFMTQSLLAGDEGDHPGIDIAIASGSYVRAAGGGLVLEAAEDPVYGRFVLIDHGNRLWSRYGHAQYLAVERGQTVRRGEVIALSGSTGRSTAPHLHFEILRNGRPVDPLSMVTPP